MAPSSSSMMRKLKETCERKGMGRECCTVDEIKSIYSKQIDSKCAYPWVTNGCLGGFYNPIAADDISVVQSCPAGFFCPMSWLCVIPCTDGATCINAEEVEHSKSEGSCAANTPCCEPYQAPPLRNMTTVPPTQQCGGASEDFKCPPGHYCPSPALDSLVCPAGHFCREGSTEPQKCPLLSHCPPGTEAPVLSLAGLLFDIIVILGFFLAVVAYKNRYAIIAWYTENIKGITERIPRPGSSAYASVASLGEAGEKAAALLENGGTESGTEITRKERTIDIEFRDLGLALKGTGRKVLSGVSGRIMNSTVVAVMGPSGAGKTTFLSTLSGKASYGDTTGTILINGHEETVDMYKRFTGFVPQEDTMHRVLKVHEILRYQAQLRLPSTVTSEEIEARVSATLRLLDLEAIKSSKIGDEETRGISGGQRKRVNIGMELVADPTLLFLDEPTSGLDSTSSFAVLRALRRVAEEGGLTILTVLHQPRYEIFSLFHCVCLLGKGGRTVYLGPTEEALPYFERLGFRLPDKMNPADFFMDVIAGDMPREGDPEFKPEDLFEMWETEQKRIGHHDAIEPQPAFPTRQTASFIRQTYIFFMRTCKLQARYLPNHMLDLALVLLAGAFLGIVYMKADYEKVPVLATMSSLCIGLTGMLAALRTFGNDRPVFWREAATGINRVAFFLGANLAQMPIILFTPLVYLSLFYTFVSPRATLMTYYVIISACQFCVTGMGYAISMIFNPRTSQMAAVVITLISSMLSGANPTLADLHDVKFFGPVAYSLSFCRWFAEACFSAETQKYPAVWLTTSLGYIDHFGYDGDALNKAVGLLILFGLIYRGLALAGLLFLNRDKQK